MLVQEQVLSEQRAWLSLSQTARIFGCSAGRVRQLVDNGTLAGTRSPLGRLVDARSAYEYIASRSSFTRRGRVPAA